MRITVLAVIAVMLFVGSAAHAEYSSWPDSIYRLNEKSYPLVAKQEKASALLRAWEFAAPNFITQFDLGTEASIFHVGDALDSLLRKQSKLTTGPEVGSVAEHYLVYSIARTQMVNAIDFAPHKLRHFFEINAGHYPCEPRATVSELVIPKTYTDATGTTAILDEVQQRLEKESFPRVAYQINDRLGKHGTGYIGELSAKKVGPERFALYQKVAEQGEPVGGSGNPVGGPFETRAGWLFIQVHSFINDDGDCFNTMKERVEQDYGREWLKKIASDTLTTAMLELRPQVTEYTTGTALESTALKVADHTLTFHDCRAALPFLMGDAGDPRFWKSIQRQALDIELIYHSKTGREIRAQPEYKELLGTLRLLMATRSELPTRLNDAATTPALRQWYKQNHVRYATFGQVSFALYECQTDDKLAAALSSPSDRAKCTAALESLSGTEKLFSSLPKADSLIVDARWSTSPVAVIAGVAVKRDLRTSVTFTKLSRELQVALQDLEPGVDGKKAGGWSSVFTEDGQQRIVQLIAIDRVVPKFEDIAQQVAGDFRLEYEMNVWKELATSEPQQEETTSTQIIKNSSTTAP